jgi:hypothetical protein
MKEALQDSTRATPSPRLLAGLVAFLSLAWLGLNAFLAARFSLASGDSMMYSLPLAFARHPFDLGIPFLGDFDGFGSAWGHQWPGAMWLRGLIFTVLPFDRVIDQAVLLVFQWLVAMLSAWCVLTAGAGRLAAALTAVMLLSDRLMLQACAGNRFETVAIAAVMLLFCSLQAGERGRAWRWAGRVGALLCPLMHPYALGLGGLMIVAGLIPAWRRACGSRREPWVRAGCFAGGLLLFALWLAIDGESRQQLRDNLALQKSFYVNRNAVIGALTNYRLGGGFLLWGGALLAAIALGVTKPDRLAHGCKLPWTARLLAPALWLAVAGVHTLSRCENFTYLAFGSPFAMIVVATAVGRWAAQADFRGRCLAIGLLVGLTCLHAAIFPFRLLQFHRAGYPDLAREVEEILERVPAGRRVLIPHVLWPAAVEDRDHEVRWWTFAVASPRATRERYEERAYGDLRAGDVLVVDHGSAGGVDKFGLMPTFPLMPPDPAKWRLVWEKKMLFPGAASWGLDLSGYEFREQP